MTSREARLENNQRDQSRLTATVLVLVLLALILAGIFMYLQRGYPVKAPQNILTKDMRVTLTAEQSQAKTAAVASADQSRVTLTPAQSKAKAAAIAQAEGEL
jgi:hypothetical protein